MTATPSGVAKKVEDRTTSTTTVTPRVAPPSGSHPGAVTTESVKKVEEKTTTVMPGATTVVPKAPAAGTVAPAGAVKPTGKSAS